MTSGDGSAQVNITVINNLQLHRYEALTGAKTAGFATYRLSEDRVVFTHTQVGDDWEGHGIGGLLARAALDDVVASGRLITPLCPFIVSYIKHHEEYVAHVDEDHRAMFA